ncbi:hypothetical protein AB0L99_10590 [Streptomyces sp. NPDC051954]|uniref:hypothetical protein n=1 Tax=unclassified Streptomyces TaxID=2593676 RepID=UPI00344A1680
MTASPLNHGRLRRRLAAEDTTVGTFLGTEVAEQPSVAALRGEYEVGLAQQRWFG